MSWTHRSARFDAEIVLLVVVAKRLHFSRKLVEIHTDVRVFVPPSPPAEVEDYQLKGGARNDAEPVKHVPQTRQRKRAAAGGAAGLRALLFTSLHHSSRQVDQVSPCMDFVARNAPASRLERSGHAAFIDNNTLFVFGGYQVSAPHLRRCALLTPQLPSTVCPPSLLISQLLQNDLDVPRVHASVSHVSLF